MNEELLITQINNAFADVPQPTQDMIASCVCGECQEIREDFAGKQPEELEEMKMQYHARDMVFFTPEARQYYIPGWMRLAIKAPDADYADTVIRILGSARGWDTAHGYTAAQKAAIVGFLRFVSSRSDEYLGLEFEIAWDEWAKPQL